MPSHLLPISIIENVALSNPESPSPRYGKQKKSPAEAGQIYLNNPIQSAN